jgi:hypothetical protein
LLYFKCAGMQNSNMFWSRGRKYSTHFILNNLSSIRYFCFVKSQYDARLKWCSMWNYVCVYRPKGLHPVVKFGETTACLSTKFFEASKLCKFNFKCFLFNTKNVALWCIEIMKMVTSIKKNLAKLHTAFQVFIFNCCLFQSIQFLYLVVLQECSYLYNSNKCCEKTWALKSPQNLIEIYKK